jgi:hypothetical protein
MRLKMSAARSLLASIAALAAAGVLMHAQVYSPQVLRKGQPDTTSVAALAKDICERAGAQTEREKAEAIWRFFLTDGRFVKPGFWYHIAGWAYEEPMGEVLDPLKLLNSYGFGLCYQIAPLLEAVWEAAGFADARTWFLTGHTVAEVFYGGAYHHFDSDMMGYTTPGEADFRTAPVVSVRQIEQDGGILLRKLQSPTEVRKGSVDFPWYPADLRARAMPGLVKLFTTTRDNWLFPFPRYPQGHSMQYVLRPGERLVRYFQPEEPGLFYLPFRRDGKGYQEFPREVSRYNIRTEDGPKSQRDARRWATGRIEYSPVLSDRGAYFPAFGPGFNENLRLPEPGAAPLLTRRSAGQTARAVFEMSSPYVILDAKVSLEASLEAAGHSLEVETSTDGGRTWDQAGTLKGPHKGAWETVPAVVSRGEHGSLTAVSGSYGYLVRLSLSGPGGPRAIRLQNIGIVTRVQLNPRTLPELDSGRNELVYRPGAAELHRAIPVRIDQVRKYALKAANARWFEEDGQGFLLPDGAKRGEILFELSAPDGSPLSGFAAGGRFLDIRDATAPDKFTAEVRKTAAVAAGPSRSAALEWALSPEGKYEPLWSYDEQLRWRDGDAIDRLLRWPEVDREVRALPPGTKKVYVRYRLGGVALDDIRLAVIAPARASATPLEITHVWSEDGRQRRHVQRIDRPEAAHSYSVETGGGSVANEAVILACPAGR